MKAFRLFLQRAAAERILRQLQDHPDTWTRVVTILQNSQNINAKFYALQVKINKTQSSIIQDQYFCDIFSVCENVGVGGCNQVSLECIAYGAMPRN